MVWESSQERIMGRWDPRLVRGTLGQRKMWDSPLEDPGARKRFAVRRKSIVWELMALRI
jgi:hypothetical protein